MHAIAFDGKEGMILFFGLCAITLPILAILLIRRFSGPKRTSRALVTGTIIGIPSGITVAVIFDFGSSIVDLLNPSLNDESMQFALSVLAGTLFGSVLGATIAQYITHFMSEKHSKM